MSESVTHLEGHRAVEVALGILVEVPQAASMPKKKLLFASPQHHSSPHEHSLGV